MPLHLIKLAVGADSIDDIRDFQQARMAARGLDDSVPVFTRRSPRRAQEIMQGGSLYWVVRGVVTVRQAVLDVRDGCDDDGRLRCELWVHPRPVLTQPTRWRPFQGWRYLADGDAPADLASSGVSRADSGRSESAMPLDLVETLDALGVR